MVWWNDILKLNDSEIEVILFCLKHSGRLFYFCGVLIQIKVGVLRPVQQPGSYWDRSSELPLVGLEPTEVTAYD